MDLNSIITLASLALTAITVWLGYRERTAAYHHTIYQKQLDGSMEMLDAISSLMADVMRLEIFSSDGKAPASEWQRCFTLENEKYKHMSHMIYKWSTLLPEEITGPAVGIMAGFEYVTLNKVTDSREIERLLEEDFHEVQKHVRINSDLQSLLRGINSVISPRDRFRLVRKQRDTA